MTHDRDRVYAQTLYSFFCFSLLALANCAFAETASIDDVEQVTNYKQALVVRLKPKVHLRAGLYSPK